MKRHRVSDYVPRKGLNNSGNKELEQFMDDTACPGCGGTLSHAASDPGRKVCSECDHSED